MSAPTNVRVIPGGLLAQPDSARPEEDTAYAPFFLRRIREIEKLRKTLLPSQSPTQAPPGASSSALPGSEPNQAHALPDASAPGHETNDSPEREAASVPRALPPEARIATKGEASKHRADSDSEQPDESIRRQGLSPTAPRKLTDQEVAFSHVAEYLLGRVTEFCSNRSVLANGSWQLQIHVDPNILPGCMLQIWLSGFSLMLRFETEDATSKALISRHSGVLKDRLSALLREHGTPREIEIISA